MIRIITRRISKHLREIDGFVRKQKQKQKVSDHQRTLRRVAGFKPENRLSLSQTVFSEKKNGYRRYQNEANFVLSV